MYRAICTTTIFTVLLGFQPLRGEVPWNIERIRAPELWNEGIYGSGIVIALLDTGVDYDHPDLAGRIWTNPGEVPDNGEDDDGNGYVDDVMGWDFADDDADPADDLGHGTAVAGVICGEGNMGMQTGVAPGAHLMICKVLRSGWGYEMDIIEAIDYAVAGGAHVVITTVGAPYSTNEELWRETTRRALSGGVSVVYSTGSHSGPPPEAIVIPGKVPPAITVTATDQDDQVAYFAARGPVEWPDYPYPPGLIKPDVAAPGVDIVTTAWEGEYITYSGTSFAAAHMAGAVALVMEFDPMLEPIDHRGRFEQSSVDGGDPGKDTDYGAGRIDCYMAAHYESPILVDLEPDTLETSPGSTVSVTVSLANMGGESIKFRGWVDVLCPWGGTLRPVAGPRDISLGPWQTREGRLTCTVPPGAPPGEYLARVRIEKLHGQPPEWSFYHAAFTRKDVLVMVDHKSGGTGF